PAAARAATPGTGETGGPRRAQAQRRQRAGGPQVAAPTPSVTPLVLWPSGHGRLTTRATASATQIERRGRYRWEDRPDRRNARKALFQKCTRRRPCYAMVGFFRPAAPGLTPNGASASSAGSL